MVARVVGTVVLPVVVGPQASASLERAALAARTAKLVATAAKFAATVPEEAVPHLLQTEKGCFQAGRVEAAAEVETRRETKAVGVVSGLELQRRDPVDFLENLVGLVENLAAREASAVVQSTAVAEARPGHQVEEEAVET